MMIILFILLVIALAFFFPNIIKVHAASASLRADACRTYNVNSIFGGVDNTEGLFCGNSDTTPRKVKHTSDTAIVETSQGIISQEESTQENIIPVSTPPTDSTPPVVTPPSNDAPSNEDTSKVKCNAGRGNGSELDSQGNDCDPGNSGEHNHGGD
jgi:hypothetical protein